MSTVVKGPCLVAGDSSLFSDGTYYHCSSGENVNIDYLFGVLGNPTKLTVVKLHTTWPPNYYENLDYIQSVINEIESNGIKSLDVTFVERDDT